jgi:hypothetical protein
MTGMTAWMRSLNVCATPRLQQNSVHVGSSNKRFVFLAVAPVESAAGCVGASAPDAKAHLQLRRSARSHRVVQRREPQAVFARRELRVVKIDPDVERLSGAHVTFDEDGIRCDGGRSAPSRARGVQCCTALSPRSSSTRTSSFDGMLMSRSRCSAGEH